MRTIASPAVVLLGIHALAGHAGPAAGQALPVVNGSFEAEAPDGGPAGWLFEPADEEAETPSWQWLPDGGLDGGACVTGGIEEKGDEGRWVQDGVAVPPEARHLRVTAWVKAHDVRSSVGAVAVGFTDAEGNPAGDALPVAVGADRDWTRHVGYVDVPEGAAAMSIACFVGYAFTKCGEFRWDNISVEAVDETVAPVTLYVDEREPPAATQEEASRGFMLFSRPWMRLVFKNSVPAPEERLEALELAAAPGAYEPCMAVVRALRPLRNVRVAVSDLRGPGGVISASRVDVRSVAYRTEIGQARWGLFNETLMEDVPQFLEKRETIALESDQNQPYWLTVHVPSDAAPGEYAGTVTVSAEGRTAEVPLRLQVDDVELLEPEGVMFSVYARMARSEEWLNETFADLRAHGVNGIAVTGSGGMPMRFEDGQPVVEWTGESALERNMAACKRHGLMEPALWLMSHEIPAFCEEAGPVESAAFGEAYRSVITQIVKHGKEQGWPEVIFQPVDEPFEWEHKLPLNKRLLELLKSVPGVRTEGDGMNGKWENFTQDVYELTDVINLHDGPMLDRHAPVDRAAWRRFHDMADKDGKLIWFYNIDLTGWHPEPVRYMTGFGLWKSGADGVIEWCYMCPVSEDDPGAVYESAEALLYRYPEAPDESGGPSLAYEAVREGVEDYRYLLTLKALCDEAASGSDAAKRALAEEAWGRVQAKLDEANFEACTGLAMQGQWTGVCEVLEDGRRVVRGNHEIENGWSLEDYDALRRDIAAAIEALSD